MKTLREMIEIISEAEYIDVFQESQRILLEVLTEDEILLLENQVNNGFHKIKNLIEKYSEVSLNLTSSDIGNQFSPISFYSIVVNPVMMVSHPNSMVTLDKIDNNVYWFSDNNGTKFKFPSDKDEDAIYFKRFVFKDQKTADKLLTWVSGHKPENWKLKDSF